MKHRVPGFLSLIAATAGLLVGQISPRAAAGDNWPQWRGPDGLGIAAPANYAEEWSAGRPAVPATDGQPAQPAVPPKNIAWKTEVPGRGHSSPVVWGNRLFLTTSIQGGHVPDNKAPDHLGFDLKPGYLHPDSVGVDYKNALKTLAFDTTNGKLLWERTAYDGVMYDNRHRKNTYASPTTVTDGKRVYAYFEAAGVYAYDFDGTPVWQTSIGKIAKAGLGPGTSPIIFENLLIIQSDQEMGANSAIVALDRDTGKEVWRTARTTRRSWATPILVRTNNRIELVASGAEMVAAYDPKTGKELWRANGVQSHPIPSPVFGHGLVYMSAGSQAKRLLALKPGGDGNQTDAAVAWKYDKGTAYVPSPILHDDYLYLMTDKGLVTCLDARTGEVKYEGGRPPVPATFTSSLVAYGDRLLMTSEDGDTFAIKAGPQHEILRTNPVGEPVFASLALAGGTIYIRGEKHLFAIRRVP